MAAASAALRYEEAAVYRDQIRAACSEAAVPEMLAVFAELEAATIELEWHGLGLTFPIPGMMMKNWTPEPMPRELLTVLERYQKAMGAARRAMAKTPLARRDYPAYWIGRLEFGIGYLDAVTLVRQAAMAENKNDSRAAAVCAGKALAEVRKAIESYARVARDQADAALCAGATQVDRVAQAFAHSGQVPHATVEAAVTEVPRQVPVRPDYRGIVVERWYESYETGKPVVEVTEGDLVRVRLRVTVPEDRAFVVVDDGLPAGLEAVDLSLLTVGGLPGPGAADSAASPTSGYGWWEYGTWDGGWWSPFEHRELHDDRVVYAARELWRGAWSVTYVARATTPGVFVRPPAYAEEMYNPAVYGRSDGGVFTVKARAR